MNNIEFKKNDKVLIKPFWDGSISPVEYGITDIIEDDSRTTLTIVPL